MHFSPCIFFIYILVLHSSCISFNHLLKLYCNNKKSRCLFYWHFGPPCDSLCLVFVAFKPMTLFYLHLGPSVLCCACFFFSFFSLQLGPGVSFYCTGVLPLYFCVCVNSFWLCRSVPRFSLFVDWSFFCFTRGLSFFLALHFSPRFCFNHI